MSRQSEPSTDSGSRTVVIGIGNPCRSDDGLGRAVAGLLRGRVPDNVSVVETAGDGAAVMEAWRGYGAVILVDALSGAGEPGTIRRLEPLSGPIPGEFFRVSTHAVGVGEAVELARTLGRLPRRMLIFGIEGADFGAGTAMSPEVEDAADRVARMILEEIRPAS